MQVQSVEDVLLTCHSGRSVAATRISVFFTTRAWVPAGSFLRMSVTYSKKQHLATVWSA
jgi:hypothetical protein